MPLYTSLRSPCGPARNRPPAAEARNAWCGRRYFFFAAEALEAAAFLVGADFVAEAFFGAALVAEAFFGAAAFAAGFFAGAFLAAGLLVAVLAKVVLLSMPDRESIHDNSVIQIAG